MLIRRPQSGRVGRALRAASLGLLVSLSFGGCSGCNCFDLGNLNCGIGDSTCLFLCPNGGGGASSTFVGGSGPGSGGGGAHPIPKGLSVALEFDAAFTPFDAVRAPAIDGFFVTATGPAGAGVYGCGSKGCGRVDGFAGWGFPSSMDALDDHTLWVVDAAPRSHDDDSALLFVLPVGSTPQRIDLGGFVPHAVARGIVKGKTRLYLSGIDGSGLPAVGYSSGLAGPPQVLHLGPPLADPAALTVDPNGVVYVIENLGPGDRAALLRVDAGSVTPVLTDLDVGYPSGVALNPPSQKLLVVVRDATSGNTRLLRVNTDGSDAELLGDTVFGAANEPGGLHGPADDGSFAIVDPSAHTVFAFR